jgi:hypothetical protein
MRNKGGQAPNREMANVVDRGDQCVFIFYFNVAILFYSMYFHFLLLKPSLVPVYQCNVYSYAVLFFIFTLKPFSFLFQEDMSCKNTLLQSC